MIEIISGIALGVVSFATGWGFAAWRYDNIHRDAMLAEVDKMGKRLDDLCKETIKTVSRVPDQPPPHEEPTRVTTLRNDPDRMKVQRHGLPFEQLLGVTPSQEEAIMRRAISDPQWLLEREQRRAQQEALDRNRAQEKQMMMDVQLRAPVPIKGVLVDGKVYDDPLSLPNKETES